MSSIHSREIPEDDGLVVVFDVGWESRSLLVLPGISERISDCVEAVRGWGGLKGWEKSP